MSPPTQWLFKISTNKPTVGRRIPTKSIIEIMLNILNFTDLIGKKLSAVAHIKSGIEKKITPRPRLATQCDKSGPCGAKSTCELKNPKNPKIIPKNPTATKVFITFL